MKLSELSNELTGSSLLFNGYGDVEIDSLQYDSRKLGGQKREIFACAPGERSDGHDYAEQAVQKGALALLCERELPLPVPQIVTKNVRAAMSRAAALLYDNPYKKLKMIAVTGTNGKTTTAYLVRSVLRRAGIPTGMLGTVVYDNGVEEIEADRTTPEGPDVQRVLAEMVQNGMKCCVMETSSHGLEQGRLEGCLFDAAGFSNLTPEHLEFHSDMEHYFAAKRLLFEKYMKADWTGVTNADDKYGRRLLDGFGGRLAGFTFSGEDFSEQRIYRGSGVSNSINGLSLRLAYPDGASVYLESPLIGDYNAANIVECVALCDLMGIDRDVISDGIANSVQVPGRLQRMNLDNGAVVFVDFAHSSDSMQKVMQNIKELEHRKLIVLWGAGGDRDATKRPVVGRTMAEMADDVIITSDNPRSEDPLSIARDVERGVVASGRKTPHSIIVDRREAINAGLDRAQPGDVVLIAGKGPESYIDYGTHKEPFSDCQCVIDWAKERSIGVVY